MSLFRDPGSIQELIDTYLGDIPDFRTINDDIPSKRIQISMKKMVFDVL